MSSLRLTWFQRVTKIISLAIEARVWISFDPSVDFDSRRAFQILGGNSHAASRGIATSYRRCKSRKQPVPKARTITSLINVVQADQSRKHVREGSSGKIVHRSLPSSAGNQRPVPEERPETARIMYHRWDVETILTEITSNGLGSLRKTQKCQQTFPKNLLDSNVISLPLHPRHYQLPCRKQRDTHRRSQVSEQNVVFEFKMPNKVNFLEFSNKIAASFAIIALIWMHGSHSS